MLEKITNTFGNIVKTVIGKATITEKHIDVMTNGFLESLASVISGIMSASVISLLHPGILYVFPKIEKAKIDTVVVPHKIATNTIVKYVRAMQYGENSSCESIYKFDDDKFEMLEFKIKNDFKIQSSIDHYMKPILDKFLHYENKILLLTTKLEDRRFGMSENEQVNIYLDIVDKYCPDNSLVVLKLHPSSKADIARVLKEREEDPSRPLYFAKPLKKSFLEKLFLGFYKNIIKP